MKTAGRPRLGRKLHEIAETLEVPGHKLAGAV